MNTQANASAEAPLGAPGIAPAQISAIRRLYWLIRRELWENRYLYLTLFIVAALFLLGFAVKVFRLPAEMQAARALSPMKQYAVLAEPYDIAAGLLMVTAMIVGAFYCLEALYGERRDRSTLFWKSLPVSDLTTVLAKASIPFVILPFLAFAITVVAQSLMLLLSSAVLAGSGHSAATLWTQLSFPRMTLLLLYHLVSVHVLWHAPLYAWLLLVSAWSRRAPFIWAFVPPAALCYLEKVTFNSRHFLNFLQYRLAGNGMDALTMSGTMPMDPMTLITPGRFLSSPGLWAGLAVTAVFLAAAVWLRRSRGPN